MEGVCDQIKGSKHNGKQLEMKIRQGRSHTDTDTDRIEQRPAFYRFFDGRCGGTLPFLRRLVEARVAVSIVTS